MLSELYKMRGLGGVGGLGDGVLAGALGLASLGHGAGLVWGEGTA